MTKERELLRRLFEELETILSAELYDEIRAYLSTTSNDAEEPVYQIAMAEGSTRTAWIDVAKDVFDDTGMYEEYKRRTLFLHPPKPAEPEAKPVLYIKEQELLYIQVLKQEGLAQEWKSNLGLVKEAGDVGLYLHPPKPAEPSRKPITEEA